MAIKIEDKPNKTAVRNRLTRFEAYLSKIKFLKWDKSIKEDVYEGQVFVKLQDTGRFIQQRTKQDIRATAFGFKHKPDALYHDYIAFEIKKIGYTGDFTSGSRTSIMLSRLLSRCNAIPAGFHR